MPQFFILCFVLLGFRIFQAPLLADYEVNSECSDYYTEYYFCPPCDTEQFNEQFNVGVEWLYWKVSEDNLRAGSFVDDFPDPVLKIANASIIQPKFKFNNGFRINVGYKFPCQQWEMNAIYTYIPLNSISDFREVIPLDQQTETHRQFIVPSLDSFPSFSGFSSNTGLVAFTSLLSKWNGNLSYADLDLARSLSLFDCFSIKYHIGFRYAWMKQNLLMAGNLIAPSTNNSTFGSLKFSEKFNGYGIEGGLWGDWQLGHGFSILGHVGGSVLYSRFHTGILSEASIGEDGPVVFIINSGATSKIGVPTLDYFAGLKYEYYFCRFSVSAHVGWEQRIFFSMNKMSTHDGYLSLQGLTLGGAVNF